MDNTTKKSITDDVMNAIHQDAREILMQGLQNLPNPRHSFDIGRIDIVPDNIDTRLQRITGGIIDLTIAALMPKLEQLIEDSVRGKIRSRI